MRLPEEQDRPPKIDILPMIDVIFAILVYFIVSSLFLTRSEGLSVNLPQANTAELQPAKQIVVSLDQAGKLTVNKQATELDNLQAQVEQLIQENSAATVVVNADKSIDHGQVVDVIDLLRQIPDVQLAIAAKKKDS